MGIFKLDRVKKNEQDQEQRRFSILLVDDEPENLRAFTSFLDKDYDITTALDGAQALELVENSGPDGFQLIISDQRMPKVTGVHFLEKTISLMPKAKRIILSGYTDADDIIDSVNRARIHEFLLKPVERNKLSLTVKRALEAYELEEQNGQLLEDLKRLNAELEIKVHERTEALKQLNDQLAAMATTDQLTGAYNRRKFDELMERDIETARRYARPLSLMLFDIDHFKQINDRFGHQRGDDVLKEVVRLVQENTRPTDSLIRWGGEEFLILVPHTDVKGAFNLAEKIRLKIEQHPFKNLETITISIGVTEYREGDLHDQFISRADEALYSAKAAGRNLVVIR